MLKNSSNLIALIAIFVLVGVAHSDPPAVTSPTATLKADTSMSEAALGKYNTAVTHFTRATQDYTTAKSSGDATQAATAQTEIAESITEMQTLTQAPEYKNDKNIPKLHSLIGYLYLLQNTSDSIAAAIPELQMTVQLNPDDLEARNNLGNALRQTGQFDAAAVQYRYILDHLKPGAGLDATKIKTTLATVLGQAGHQDESLALFGELAAASPDPATLKNYAYFLQKAGKYTEAVAALQKAADANPKDSEAWYSAGQLYLKTGSQDQAITALTKAVGPDVDPKLDPKEEYDAYFALGEAYAAKGTTNEAIQAFDSAARLQPQNAVPLYNKGVLQEQAGLSAEAETSYRSALTIDPENAQISTALGLLLADKGKASEAAPLLAKGTEGMPQDAKAAPIYARLGDMYAQLKDYPQANAARQQALKLNPTDINTRLALADTLMAQKQYVSALAQYDAAAKARPNDAAIQNQRGVAYKNLKQYPKALAAFKQALALNPRNAQIQNNVGVIYELLNNKAQAIVAYKKALALDPNLAQARLNLQRFAEQ